MVEKDSNTTIKMVEKPEEKKSIKKLNTYVIMPDNIAIEALTEQEAINIYNKTKK